MLSAYIKKKCPQYWILQEAYETRVDLNPPHVSDSLIEREFDCVEIDNLETESSNSQETVNDQSQLTTTSTQSQATQKKSLP